MINKAKQILRNSLPNDINTRFNLYLNNLTIEHLKTDYIEQDGNYYSALCETSLHNDRNPDFKLKLSNANDEKALHTLVHELGHITEGRKLTKSNDKTKYDISGLKILKNNSIYGNMLTECLREILTENAFLPNPLQTDLTKIEIQEANISAVYAPFINLTQLFLFTANKTKTRINLENYKNNLLLDSLFNNAFLIESIYDQHTKIGEYEKIMKLMDSYCNSSNNQIDANDYLTILNSIKKFYLNYIKSSNLTLTEYKQHLEEFTGLFNNCINEFINRKSLNQ